MIYGTSEPQPVVKSYTLDISPVRKIVSASSNKQEGLRRALHICRGHFASYSEEKPLFGKIAGTFWIPDHLRGSSEKGTIKKDYRLVDVGAAAST